jgi:hypothetical protein
MEREAEMRMDLMDWMVWMEKMRRERMMEVRNFVEDLLGCSKNKKIFPNFYSLPVMFGRNLKRREVIRCLDDAFGGNYI